MKFSCLQENFNSGLSAVSHLAAKNVSLPILNNVLLKAEKGSIKLLATNLEQAITTEIRGKVEQEGVFSVSARLLGETVTLLARDRVDVNLHDQELYITSKNTKVKIKGLQGTEYPVIPEIRDGVEFELLEKDLKQALQQAAFAAAQDESRPEISGALIRFDNEQATVVATDSYRLAERSVPLKKGSENKQVILPIRTVHELLRLFSESDAEAIVRIRVAENQILFVAGETAITSRIIEGQFPDYKQIIPTNFQTAATVQSTELLNAVKTASLFCKPGVNDVIVRFDQEKKQLTVAATNSQTGESETTVAGDVTGEPNTITFNYRYLLDGLLAIGEADVVLEMNNGGTPGVLRQKSAKDYLYLIMPIKQ